MHQEKGGVGSQPSWGDLQTGPVCMCVCVKWECEVRGQADDRDAESELGGPMRTGLDSRCSG